MTFLDFLASLSGFDIACIVVAWLAIAAALGMFTGKAIRTADEHEQWDDTDALPTWINDHDTVPDYIPQSWFA